MRSIFKMPSDDMPPNGGEGALHYYIRRCTGNGSRRGVRS